LDNEIDRGAAAEVGQRRTSISERRVKGAVGQVSDERPVVAPIAVGRARNDDPRVVLKRDRSRELVAAEVGQDDSVAAEARVECSVGRVARDGEV
jgi:hypothetical protein